MSERIYLDWNATSPLRPEARAAMVSAMDFAGNPSSVHSEGRKAKGLIEAAREDVAELAGCAPDQIVFTSGATEAAALVLGSQDWDLICPSVDDHDAITAYADSCGARHLDIDGFHQGDAFAPSFCSGPRGANMLEGAARPLVSLPVASGETGIVTLVDPDKLSEFAARVPVLRDMTQSVGRGVWMPKTETTRRIGWKEAGSPPYAILSAHKLGGPKGVGALILGEGIELAHPGGGQELGRRSGTENVIGIAGFGAAARAVHEEFGTGVWEKLAKLRKILETNLENLSKETIIFGKGVPRLANTSLFATPGWRGDMQVMRLDLAGFAVSAGSACSSGKVADSRVLKAMGFGEKLAASALRVSMGPGTTQAEIEAFVQAWAKAFEKWKTRKAA